VVNAWRQLTRRQYAAWQAAAWKANMNTYPFFCKINGALAAARLPLVMDPPKPEKIRPNPVEELEIRNRGGVITLRLWVPQAPAQHTFVLGSRWCSRGIWVRGNKFAIIGELPPAKRGWCDITELYVNAFGVPPVGQRVFIRTGSSSTAGKMISRRPGLTCRRQRSKGVKYVKGVTRVTWEKKLQVANCVAGGTRARHQGNTVATP